MTNSESQQTQHTLSPQAPVPGEAKLLAYGKTTHLPRRDVGISGFGKNTPVNTRSKSSPGSSEPHQCTDSERQGWLSISIGHVPSRPSLLSVASSVNPGGSPRESTARRDTAALPFHPAPRPVVPPVRGMFPGPRAQGEGKMASRLDLPDVCPGPSCPVSPRAGGAALRSSRNAVEPNPLRAPGSDGRGNGVRPQGRVWGRPLLTRK